MLYLNVPSFEDIVNYTGYFKKKVKYFKQFLVFSTTYAPLNFFFFETPCIDGKITLPLQNCYVFNLKKGKNYQDIESNVFRLCLQIPTQ